MDLTLSPKTFHRPCTGTGNNTREESQCSKKAFLAGPHNYTKSGASKLAHKVRGLYGGKVP
eukprot:c24276_g1_i1 orf=78-260(+)